jgi:chromosome segregation ATPase
MGGVTPKWPANGLACRRVFRLQSRDRFAASVKKRVKPVALADTSLLLASAAVFLNGFQKLFVTHMKSATRFTIAEETGTAAPEEVVRNPSVSVPGAEIDPAAQRQHAETEKALNDVIRREHILAVQLKAHRHCAAQLAEERARFEAERAASTAHAADEALAQAREELERERVAFVRWTKNEAAELERRKEVLARREAEIENARTQLERERQRNASLPAPEVVAGRVAEPDADTHRILEDLARRAVDFAALVEAVTHTRRKLDEARSGHEAMVQRHLEEMREREDGVAARESAAAGKIQAAEAELEAQRRLLGQAQEDIAAREGKLTELQRELEASEVRLGDGEKLQRETAEKLAQETARLETTRKALLAEEERLRQRQSELDRLEQAAQGRSAALIRRQAEITAAEQEIVAARQETLGMLETAARTREELDAASAQLATQREAFARAEEEQQRARAACDQRNAALAEQAAMLEEKGRQIAREAAEVQQHAAAVDNERTALETQRTALGADETALVQRMLAFDERQRKFRESISNFMAE